MFFVRVNININPTRNSRMLGVFGHNRTRRKRGEEEMHRHMVERAKEKKIEEKYEGLPASVNIVWMPGRTQMRRH